MNRRAFLKWFGIGVPAAAVAAVVVPALGTSAPEKVTEARLGEWNNYYSEGDPELMEAIENWKSYPVHHTATLAYDKDLVQSLKSERTMFAEFASGRKLPIAISVKRKVFQYDAVS